MGASCSVDGLSDEIVQLAQSHADSLREKGVTTDELLGPAMSLYIDALRCTQKPEVTPIETAAAFSKAFKADAKARAAALEAATSKPETAERDSAGGLQGTVQPPDGTAMMNVEGEEYDHVKSHIGMVTNQAYHTFLMALDGRKATKPAFDACLRLMKNRDHIRLFHCFDPSEQSSLSSNEKADAVREFYSVECIGKLSRSRWESREEDWVETPGLADDRGTTLTKMVNRAVSSSGNYYVSRARPSFVVVGTDFSDGVHQGPSILGSKVDLSMNRLILPSIVVKVPCKNPDEVVFAASVKDPTDDKRLLPLEIAMSLKKEKDKLLVVWLKDADTSEDVETAAKAAVEREIIASGLVNVNFVALTKQAGTAVHETLDSFCTENSVDFLVLAPTARPDMTNMTHHFVKKSMTNVVICKKQ